MTEAEFAEWMLDVRGRFSGELRPERLAAIQRACAGWRFVDAIRALDRLVADGTTWLPTPGELVLALQRAHGGIGSWRAKAALAGMTPEELADRLNGDFVERLGTGPMGEFARQERRELERARRSDLARTSFVRLLEGGRPPEDGESGA